MYLFDRSCIKKCSLIVVEIKGIVTMEVKLSWFCTLTAKGLVAMEIK